MAGFNEKMQRLFDRYVEEVDSGPVSLEDVAEWAIRKGLYQPHPRDAIRLCKEELAESLRQEKRTDAKGRKYRAKHSMRTKVGSQQLTLWHDIDQAPRSFMEKSFQQRRKGIVNDCFQVKVDVDHFNDTRSGEAPIQMVLDFTEDVAEIEAAARQHDDDDEAA